MGLIMSAAALSTLWKMARLRRQISDSRSWPSVTGTITGTGTEGRWKWLGRSFHRIYSPTVTYEYSVGGARYAGHRVGFPEINTSFRSRAERIAARYAVGIQVLVHYDPADPEEAFLEREPDAQIFMVLGAFVGVAGLLFGLSLVFRAIIPS